MKKVHTLVVGALLLGPLGCASGTNGVLKENEALRARIQQVQEENQNLQRRLDDCGILAGTLEREKRERESDLASVRAQARSFVRSQYDALVRFSRSGEWLDYIGGEPIQRRNVEDKGVTIVLAKKELERDAVLYGVKGYFEPETRLVLKLFRPSGGGFVCIWEGPAMKADRGGPGRIDLATPLAAQKGDLVGFHFPDKAGVPFDEKTGGFEVFRGDVKVGDFLPKAPDAAERNYSVGVAGMLD